MYIHRLYRISTAISCMYRRTFYSYQINSLFINNFDKYYNKVKSETQGKDTDSRHLIKLLDDFNNLSSGLKDVEKEISDKSQTDSELKSLMKAEFRELKQQQELLTTQILSDIYSYEQSKDNDRIADSSSVIFEISAGVGGKEAMLFANELCMMYINYFLHKRWNIQDVESDEQNGYLRHYNAKIEGINVWSNLKYEAGVHRVQRVPETEARGRVHTSTVSIACIPITDDSVIEVIEKDLKIETKRASGAGGQHVNKTESAIRMTHMPTNISVECQEDRSQLKNREIAMKKLRKILTDRYINETFARISKTRKSQVGQANRNEKIRTFNFHQDRVTDHRLSSLNVSSNDKKDTLFDLEGFFNNPERLDEFINSLKTVEREQELLDLLKEVEKL